MSYTAYTAVRLLNGRTYTEGIEIDPDGKAVVVGGVYVQETITCEAFKVIVKKDRTTVFKPIFHERTERPLGYKVVAIFERQWSYGIYGTYGFTWYQFLPAIKAGSPPSRVNYLRAVLFGILALALFVLAFFGLPGLLFFAFPAAVASACAVRGSTGVLYDRDLPHPCNSHDSGIP